MKQILVLVLSLSPLFAFAETHREVQTVEVVQVPVYVTSGGEPLRGLTRDRFELFVNGKWQRIDYFDVIDYSDVSTQSVEASPNAPAAPAAVRQRQLTVFVFDAIPPKMIGRAQSAVTHAIEKASPNDLFAICAIAPLRGLRIVVPFTHDHLVLHNAIASLAPVVDGDPLGLQVASAELAPVIADDPRQGVNEEERSGVAKEQLGEPARRAADNLIGDLSHLAERLTPMEGVKHVVLLSAGFDSGLLANIGSPSAYRSRGLAQEPLQTPFGMLAGSSVTLMNATAMDPGKAFRSMKQLASSFTSAGVFLDAVNVAGIPEATDLNPSRDESLFAMAEPTGGAVVHNDNDITRAVTRLTETQKVVYLLGFHAKPTGRKMNAIQVKLRGANATIRYRTSYSTEIAAASTSDPLRLAYILANDIPQTGVNLALSVRTSDQHATVDAAVHAPELFALTESPRIEAEAYIYVYSGSSAVASALKKIEIAHDGAVHVVQDFDLPSGAYAVKVLWRMEGTDSLGFARQDFVVP